MSIVPGVPWPIATYTRGNCTARWRLLEKGTMIIFNMKTTHPHNSCNIVGRFFCRPTMMRLIYDIMLRSRANCICVCILKCVRRITIGFLSLRCFVCRVDNRDRKRRMKRSTLKATAMKRPPPAARWIWPLHRITIISQKSIRFDQQCDQCHFQGIASASATASISTAAPAARCQTKTIWLHRAIAFGKRTRSTVIGLAPVHRAWGRQILA